MNTNTTTSAPVHTPADLITALDGPVAVARLLTDAGHVITPQAVTIWKKTGIPTGRVVQIAFAMGRVINTGADVEPANWARLFPELLRVKASKAA